MLKGIPPLLTPDLLKYLMEMGHGDELVIADGNFPASAVAKRLVRLDGHSVADILRAVTALFPLDTYVPSPVFVMQPVAGDVPPTATWASFEAIVREQTALQAPFEQVERFAFYEQAKKAYVIIASSDLQPYTNIILKKGVITAL